MECDLAGMCETSSLGVENDTRPRNLFQLGEVEECTVAQQVPVQPPVTMRCLNFFLTAMSVYALGIDALTIRNDR